jgi:hypothetical protein
MANKKDYSKIREKNIKYLPPFEVLHSRLPEYLGQANQQIQSLQISKTVLGELESTLEVYQGAPLILGRQYTVYLEEGDDFSNTGFVENNLPFIAIAENPIVWSNSSIVQLIKPLTIYYNDIDPNIYVENDNGVKILKITNNGFVENKTFPNVASGAIVVDSNTINLGQSPGRYFKIEVYI